MGKDNHTAPTTWVQITLIDDGPRMLKHLTQRNYRQEKARVNKLDLEAGLVLYREVRSYLPVFNEGCCYCLGKKWRECRFGRLRRVGNEAVKRVVMSGDER